MNPTEIQEKREKKIDLNKPYNYIPLHTIHKHTYIIFNPHAFVCSHSQASISGSALQTAHGDLELYLPEEEFHAAL